MTADKRWYALDSWEQQDPGVYIVEGKHGRVVYAEEDVPLSPLDAQRIAEAVNAPLALLTAETIKGAERMRKFTITDPSGSPYLTRYVIEEFPDGSAIYLHLIHRSDADREHHDHPWDFRSFIVRGGYIEHAPGREPREFYPGQWNVRKAEHLHRLELFNPGEDTVTILFRGPKRREWGFVGEDGEWIHNEKYLEAKFGKGNYTKEYE